MSNPLVDIQKHGQSIWYDNISRGLILSGDLKRMVEEDGLRGVTSNPAIFEKAVGGSKDYEPAMKSLVRQGENDAETIFEHLAIQDIQLAADVLYPVYEKTNTRDGYVSLEVSPRLAADTKKTIEEGRRLHAAVGRDNLMIKVPATPEGIPAIEQLIADGINVNVTLLFAVEAYADAAQAYLAGLERAADAGRDLSRIASVASFFVSRIDSLVDEKIQSAIDEADASGRKGKLQNLLGKIAIANAKLAYAHYKKLVADDRWKALAAKGAQTQRVLWASTSTKNPDYPKSLYVDELIAKDTVNTIPGDTFEAFKKEGSANPGLNENWEAQLDEAREQLSHLEEAGISLKEATYQLLSEGVEKFVQPFDKLLATIDAKRKELTA